MMRSPLRCCTSIIRSSALVQASSSLSIGRTCAWPRRLPITEMHFRHFSCEFFIGPATILQDNLAELHVPIRSGNTPRTKHPYTIRNHLNTVFAHPQTLADIGISKQAHLTHLAALHTAWQNTRCATIKYRVQLAVTQQTINRD